MLTKEEFYSSLEEWVSKPKDKWNHVTLVAYFYHKYYLKNGVHFSPVRWNGNPASSKECRDFTKIFKIFTPENYMDLDSDVKRDLRIKAYQKIYNYINWMFDYKHRTNSNGKAITTQFFISPYVLNEFELMYNSAMNKNQTEDKMKILLQWCKQEAPSILDLHQIDDKDDIRMLEKYAKMHDLPEHSDEKRLILKAKQIGIL